MVPLALAIFLVSLCRAANEYDWESQTESNYIQRQLTANATEFVDVNFEIYNIWSVPKDNRAYFYGNFYDSTIIGTENKMMLFNIIPYSYGNDWRENSEFYFTGYIGSKIIWKYSLNNDNNTISWFTPKTDSVLNKIIIKIGSFQNLYLSITTAVSSSLCKVNIETFSLSFWIKFSPHSVFSIVPIPNDGALYLLKILSKNDGHEYPAAIETYFRDNSTQTILFNSTQDNANVQNIDGDYTVDFSREYDITFTFEKQICAVLIIKILLACDSKLRIYTLLK